MIEIVLPWGFFILLAISVLVVNVRNKQDVWLLASKPPIVSDTYMVLRKNTNYPGVHYAFFIYVCGTHEFDKDVVMWTKLPIAPKEL